MKSEEKQRALALRSQGWSYNQILTEVGVSKSSLSLWLRDLPLSKEQIAGLASRVDAGREKFSRNHRFRRNIRWARFYQKAEEEYTTLSLDPDFMFGLALYVGEGSKFGNNLLCLTNCDPRVIRKGIRFFEKIGIARSSMRVAIQIHPGLSAETAEAFWPEVTGLPPEQFHVTRDVTSRASGNKKGHAQLCGTCQVRACSTELRQKVARWMALALEDGPLV